MAFSGGMDAPEKGEGGREGGEEGKANPRQCLRCVDAHGKCS